MSPRGLSFSVKGLGEVGDYRYHIQTYISNSPTLVLKVSSIFMTKLTIFVIMEEIFVLGLTGGVGCPMDEVITSFFARGVRTFNFWGHARQTVQGAQGEDLRNRYGLVVLKPFGEVEIRRALMNIPQTIRDATLKEIASLTLNRFLLWLTQVSHTSRPYVVLASNILFDTMAHTSARKVVQIVTPLRQRMTRCVDRGMTEEEFEFFNGRGMHDVSRFGLSNYTVVADERNDIDRTVGGIHNDILGLRNLLPAG